MDDKAKIRFEARAKILKAMAHGTRLYILSELSKGEQCVCTLTELIGVDISTVSRHLSVLRNAGLITSEKRGNQVFYQLRCTCIHSFFDCIESVIQKNASHVRDSAQNCR